MGRDAGWIALDAGMAGGAHVILIPEIPFSLDKICDYVLRAEGYGKRFTIVVVAEGVKLPPGAKHPSRGGSAAIWSATRSLTAHKEVRVSVLGHIQRGGSPSPFDRVLATRFGVAAVDLIAPAASAKWSACTASVLKPSTSPKP